VEINFEHLIRLQGLDEEIKAVSLFLESLPSRVRAIDQKIQESAKIVADAKSRLAENQKRRRDLEGRVLDKKTLIGKYRKQLNDVKTNKEYTSLLKEIADVESEIETLEEEIISEMLTADDLESEIKTAEKRATEAKDTLLLEKEVLQQQGKGKEEEKKLLQQERGALVPSITDDLIDLYTRIFRKNDGIALSPVTDDFCSMCQIRIRPQVLNELIAQKEIILCENCGRILYWKPKN
jgi:predicted  nucleic acid-binding Zn-ribbon protein